jgi:hypothetical protein
MRRQASSSALRPGGYDEIRTMIQALVAFNPQLGPQSAVQAIPIDAEIGQRAGVYLTQYAKSRGFELGDALIAATACLHDLQLWTRNRRHYPMKDLRCFENLRRGENAIAIESFGVAFDSNRGMRQSLRKVT